MTISDQAAKSASAAPDAELSAGQKAELDADIQALTAGNAGWAQLPLDKRAALLRDVHATVSTQAEQWAHTAARLKGLELGSPLVGEEWMSGPYAVLTALDATAVEAVPRLEVREASNPPARARSVEHHRRRVVSKHSGGEMSRSGRRRRMGM